MGLFLNCILSFDLLVYFPILHFKNHFQARVIEVKQCRSLHLILQSCGFSRFFAFLYFQIQLVMLFLQKLFMVVSNMQTNFKRTDIVSPILSSDLWAWYSYLCLLSNVLQVSLYKSCRSLLILSPIFIFCYEKYFNFQ